MKSIVKVQAVVMLPEGTLETVCLARPEAVEQIIDTALELTLRAIVSIKGRGEEEGGTWSRVASCCCCCCCWPAV